MKTIRRTAKKRNADQRAVSREKRTADNITFDSVPELEHYLNLKLLEKKGKIRQLRIQPMFRFVIGGDFYGTYTADFSFVDCATDKLHVHDVKAWTGDPINPQPIVSREYKYQKALVRLQFGIIVEEV